MTPTIEANERLLKTDERGRVRTPPARREALLQEFERSGLSAAKFAALAGIKYPTFAAWLQKRRRQAGPVANAPTKSEDPVQWLEAVVEQAQLDRSQSTTLVLELPGRTRVEIRSVDQLPLAAALLRALEKPC